LFARNRHRVATVSALISYRKFESFSVRHPPERSSFWINEQAENPRAKVGFSRIMAVLEIADFWHNWSGDGIFLQSFVLRRFRKV